MKIVKPLQPGSAAPSIPDAKLEDGPLALLFYKVTCPTCQMTASVAERFAADFPGRFVAIVQDAPDRVEDFERQFGTTFPSISDTEPYEASNAYGIRTVPTLFVVEDGYVTDVTEAWDREGWNRLATRLAVAHGREPRPVSEEGDGLPPLRPG